MSIFTTLLGALFFLAPTAVSASTQHIVDIHAWPVSSTSSQPLARITYTHPSLNATVKSYTSPSFSSDDIVRVGFYRSGSEDASQWSGVATSALNFAPELEKTLRLHVDDSGRLYHVGFRARDATTDKTKASSKTAKTVPPPAARSAEGLNVEVVQIEQGPQPHLNKPVVLNPEGKVEGSEQEQKTFLQKYWWAIGLFLLIQVVMGGGGDK